jgi:carbon storage regulator
MLVLTRKLMEKLYIGDDICVTVVRLEGGQVRLGIEAPREVSVVRAELVPDREANAPHPAIRPPMGLRHHDVRTRPGAAHGTGIRRPERSR